MTEHTAAESIGPWRLGASLGHGREGELVEACGDDGRRVALRFPAPLPLVTARARLQREADVRARLGSGHGLALSQDVGALEDGRVWVALDLVPGARSFESAGGTMAERLGILRAAATTLARLHRRGVHHGALRSGSLLVTPDGHVTLADLGAGDPAARAATDVGALAALLPESGPEIGARARQALEFPGLVREDVKGVTQRRLVRVEPAR